MKTTKYFEYTKLRSDRSFIKEKWIEQTNNSPIKVEIQSDGRIRKWSYIEEEDKFLRIILLEDGETLHNAFFDRTFKGDKK